MASSSNFITKTEAAFRAAQVRQILDWFKSNSFQREEASQTLRKAELLKAYSQLKGEYAAEDQSAMVSAYEKLPRAVVDMWSYKNAKNESKITDSFSLLLDALGAVIEASEAFCRHVSKQGVIQLFIADLSKAEFLAVRKGEADSRRKRFVEQYLTIMHNIINAHGVADGANAIRSANGVEILCCYVESEDDFIKIETLFVLGAVVNDEEQEKLSAVIQESTVAVIIRLLKQSKHGEQAICTATVLTDVSLVANFSEVFVDLLMKQDILAILEEIITSNESHYNLLHKHLAAKCCWSFTFYSAGREAIKSRGSLLSAMEQMSHNAASEDLSRACSGVLWGMHNSEAPPNQSVTPFAAKNEKIAQPQQGHIMLSYSWNSQQTVLKMNDYLKANGVRTWIDVNDMHGSTVAAMAAAVEKCTAVVVCVSQAYFQSANCRAEAEYAFNLKKPIIPARMENYKARGWLGLILGAKLYYDFADGDEQRFNDAVSRLLAGILEVSKPDSNLLPDPDVANLQGDSIDDKDDAALFVGKNKPENAMDASRKLVAQPNVDVLRHLLEKWKPEEVKTWLQLNGLAKYGQKFEDYDGQAFLGMIIMQYRAPDVLYDSLRVDLRLDLLGLTRFVSALNKLATHPKQALGIDVA